MHTGRSSEPIVTNTYQNLVSKPIVPSALQQLYIQILHHRHSPTIEKHKLDCFRQVVGSLCLLYEYLSSEALSQLLGIPARQISAALRHFWPIVAVDDPFLHIRYPSFSKLIINKEICPSVFLVNESQQHTTLARGCFAVMNKLFSCGLQFIDSNIPPEVAYALGFFDDHVAASAAESRQEFLEILRVFVNTHLPKWLTALARCDRSRNAIICMKRIHEWVVRYFFTYACALSFDRPFNQSNSFPQELEFIALLKDVKWCIAEYYNDRGIEAEKLGDLDEASDWWSTSEKAFLQLIDSADSFLRQTVYRLGMDGSLEKVKTVTLDAEMIDEAKAVLGRVVDHRCGLTHRQEVVQQFLEDLADNVGAYQRELSIDFCLRRTHLLQEMGSTFEHLLAASFHDLGYHQSKLEKWKETVESTQNAVDLRRSLFATDSHTYQPSFAASLHNLGLYQSKLRDWEAAMQATEQALELRQALYATDPEEYCEDLAWSYHNLGDFRSEMKQWSRAAEAMQKAVELRQELFVHNSETYREDLAWSLHNLACYLGKLNELERAVELANQALVLRQYLFDVDPTAHRKSLVWSFQTLEFFYSELGDHDAAADARKKAVGLRDVLLREDADKYRVDVANWVNGFGWFLRDSQRPEKGLSLAQEAIAILRVAPSMGSDPEFQASLACTLDTVAACLHDIDRSEEGLPYSKEAITLIISLHKQIPSDSGYRVNLVDIADIHSKILTKLGREEEVRLFEQEVAEIRATWVSKNADDFDH